jgi:hypothetical protein
MARTIIDEILGTSSGADPAVNTSVPDVDEQKSGSTIIDQILGTAPPAAPEPPTPTALDLSKSPDRPGVLGAASDLGRSLVPRAHSTPTTLTTRHSRGRSTL